jgi:hypothetical protein
VTRHLLVIGAQRCGTTYLARLLEAHPDIAMARPARPEPKVFLSPDILVNGRQWYVHTYFAHATSQLVLAEKSTSYLEVPEAAARAREVLGEATIVVQLRDPVARAVSNWRFSTEHGLEERGLEEALEDDLVTTRDWDRSVTSVSPYAYLERGRYVGYLRPWFTAFPGNVHVRFLEDVVTSRSSAADLYRAAGVDPGFEPSQQDNRVNASRVPEPELSGALRQRLRAYFSASDAELSRQLGRSLPWPAVDAQRV